MRMLAFLAGVLALALYWRVRRTGVAFDPYLDKPWGDC